MKFTIKHEIRGRIRVHLAGKTMTIRQADLLYYYLNNLPYVSEAKVYERTNDAAICFKGSRKEILSALQTFHFQDTKLEELVPKNSGRELNRIYKEKLIHRMLWHGLTKLYLPVPIRAVYQTVRAIPYLYRGIKSLMRGKLEVEVLDATAISVSLVRGDFKTAGSIMFLLGIGELLEEWTHKKSIGDLARSMALNVKKVWLKTDEEEVLVPISRIQQGDHIVVHMGNMIPLDGIVTEGEAMVNQASMTGESLPVKKEKDSYAYAGTAVEEGEIILRVEKAAGDTRYERVARMIEESEKLKSSVEGKATNLADALVPWSLGGTVLTYLLTRNTTKALSILMVDFSCALKLAMPLAVLSAIREAQNHAITVKGGKFLELIDEADTIVFDKTGTLTKAEPKVAQVVAFENRDEEEMLRIAACLEEHFPHSIANAVVREAARRGQTHEEMHSKVDYIVAHGIATYIDEERVIIGSHHFVFEDEKCQIPQGEEERFHTLPEQYSHLFLAIAGRLAAVICIEDPLRLEASQVVQALRQSGISNIVMMTGDSERTARAIAAKVGVDAYDSEVLPEDKARFVEEEKAKSHKVIMVGDGINDSPALSAADVGIAISEGAEIAREVADITISEDNLYQLVTLKTLSTKLMIRIGRNYRTVIGFNLGLIVLGVLGVIAPTTSALLHNTSTILVSLKSMTNLLEEIE